MVVTAWNNGTRRLSGAGYGVKVRPEDREHNFQRDWETIIICLENRRKEVEVNVKKQSFWNRACGELISKEIGTWLILNELAPWKKGKPPKLELVPDKGNRFFLNKFSCCSK